MAIGVTWLLRNTTTTNSCSHSFVLNTAPLIYEGAYADGRYFNSHDTTGWDGVTETNYQGTTADGNIIRTDTVEYGVPPTPAS